MIPFGKKIRVGNFELIKTSKGLNKEEQILLRSKNGIPRDAQKILPRASVPYLTVKTISGTWSVSFAAGATIFLFMDSLWDDEKKCLIEQGNGILVNLFTMWYSDTAILGDKEYIEAKGKALKDYMGRMKADEGGGDLKDVKTAHEAELQIRNSLNSMKDE